MLRKLVCVHLHYNTIQLYTIKSNYSNCAHAHTIVQLCMWRTIVRIPYRYVLYVRICS